MNPSNPNKEYGEGNYKGSREYNEATKKFVDSGRVDEAARNARPTSEDEAREMSRAEAEGRSHAKEEDPALRKGATPATPDRESDPRGTPRNERSADAKDTPQPGQEGE